jgi:hypothetical protein
MDNSWCPMKLEDNISECRLNRGVFRMQLANAKLHLFNVKIKIIIVNF